MEPQVSESPLLPRSAASLDKTFRVYRNAEYPKELWYFLASLIFIISVLQYTTLVLPKLSIIRRQPQISSPVDPESPRGPSPSRRLFWRRVPLALVNALRIIAFRWAIDLSSYSLNLTEVALTCVYIIALFTWTFINTTDVSGVKFDLNYWNDRSGVLALSQLPLVTVLGTKNLISALTLVGHEKLNYLHRMTSRVVFVLICVHAGGRLQSGLGDDLYESWLHAGLLAGFSFLVLCILSLRPIRAKKYEFFLYTHFFMVLILLIGVYFHARNFSPFYNYVWPCFVIWGMDRLIRLTRIIVFNFAKNGSDGTIDAKIELVSEHLVRVILRPPKHFTWSPGQMAYLMAPGVSSLPFEAHPFTIASYDGDTNVTATSTSESSSKEKFEDDVSERGEGNPKEVVFLINVKNGFTRRLAEAAAKKKSIKAILDGPYGLPPDLTRFGTSVFIAGGTGISYTLPILLKTIEQVRQRRSQTTRVVFIWVIRYAAHLSWVSNSLHRALNDAPKDLVIEVRIFLTDTTTTSDSIDWDNDSVHSSGEGTVGTREKGRPRPSLLSLPLVSLEHQRPNLAEILSKEAEQMDRGKMSVTVCGSQSVAKAARSALRFNITGPAKVLRGGPSISLHVESFGFA